MILGKTARHILKTLREKGFANRGELLAGVKPEHASKSWGNSYFLPADSRSNGYYSSLLRRGLIMKFETSSNYVLTTLGWQVTDTL